MVGSDSTDRLSSPTSGYVDMAQPWQDLELSLVKANGQANGHSPHWQRNGDSGCSSSNSVTRPLVEPEVEEEVVDLSHTCYNLIFVSGRASVLAPMLAVAAGQFGMLWIVGWTSPEYFFESGQWIVPISDYWSVNAMKCLSMLLTLFRVSGEFKDAAKLYRVLTHRPAVHMTLQQRILGFGAFLLQYLVAVVVLLMAIQLILASTTPIATIGKLWVVFATLDFDNYLCNFILFIFDCEHAFDWGVSLSRRSVRRLGGPPCRTWLLIYWAPVGVALLCVCLSVYFNICPLTAVHYGPVENLEPVLMLTSAMGLPQSCCAPQVHIPPADVDHGVQVSVPCVTTSEASSQNAAPEVYYVVVPDGRPSPSSLQVMDGRGGDGNRGLRYGQVTARPLQMRWWLTSHGFEPTVYDVMRKSGTGGLGLYQSNFPNLAEWKIQDFPWGARARIFVTAVNPSTGALSPLPVQSAVIMRKVCSSHCLRCDSEGACLECDAGFVLQEAASTVSLGTRLFKICAPCGLGCAKCNAAGAGHCDAGGCLPGHGLADKVCLPCAGTPCLSCDQAGAGMAPLVLSDAEESKQQEKDGLTPSAAVRATELPCRSCPATFGLGENGRCQPCQVQGCRNCPELGMCQACKEGATLRISPGNGSFLQECLLCAEHCARCELLGEGRCDPEQCHPGFSLTPTGVCAPCSMHCSNCTKAGPGHCDLGSCRPGYGLQGAAGCSKCQVEGCDVCDSYGCDVCREGFGLTPDRSCEACATACKRCTGAGGGGCAECVPGFGLEAGHCSACADQCEHCEEMGPGQCDVGACASGWLAANVSGAMICVRDRRPRDWPM
ncbi:unnamed protein product [Effrenium voratum]|uniref:EGF-like domain-containing protein n=1 Tax=Effrenium voratum TaxID=2562239 RepID=A0AA36J5E3_9DINO|nr:unnamed protein product [Effrenium voratum]